MADDDRFDVEHASSEIENQAPESPEPAKGGWLTKSTWVALAVLLGLACFMFGILAQREVFTTDGIQIGITLAVGGGTVGYPQFSVGYKDDFLVYQVTSSNATQISRFGDYVSNRPIAGGLFAAEVYDVILNPLPAGVTSGSCSTVGCTANMRFVEYGRPPLPPIH